MHAKLVFSLILAGLVVLFIIQNVTVVGIRFLLWVVGMSLSLLIIFILAIGILVVWSLYGYILHKREQSGNKPKSSERIIACHLS